MDRNILAVGSAITVLVGCLIQPLSAIGQEGDIDVHDPCIVKEGSYYYIFSTHDGIHVRKSSDLKHWERDGEVLPGGTQLIQADNPGDLWAPDVSFFNGKYHLYYATSTFGTNRSWIGLATNKTLDRHSALFHWVDEGLVVRSKPQDNFNAIDPNVVLDQNGTPWLSFNSFWSGIQIVRLDKHTGKPLGRAAFIAGRQGGAIEAPYIIRRARYYYLFVSFDSCCKGVDSDYKIMVGRSQNVAGPYVNYTGQKLLNDGGTLVLAGYGRFHGPGHNSVLREGDTDYLVHHFYDGENAGRHTLQIRSLVWSRDGWPLAGEPIPTKAETPRTSVVGSWRHSVNFESETTISLLREGTMKGTKNTWQVQGSRLQLRWYRDDAPGGVWVDDCLVSPDRSWYVGRNQHGAVIRGVRSS